MKAEEKSKELVDKYLKEFLDDSGCGWTEKCASICAKICVQEIISINISYHGREIENNLSKVDYWKEVLNHLNEM